MSIAEMPHNEWFSIQKMLSVSFLLFPHLLIVYNFEISELTKTIFDRSGEIRDVDTSPTSASQDFDRRKLSHSGCGCQVSKLIEHKRCKT